MTTTLVSRINTRALNALVRSIAPSLCLTIAPGLAASGLPAVALGVFCVRAEAQELAPHQIDAEIDFARGLATSWQFLDLSENVLNRLEGLPGLSGSQREGLALARCEVFSAGARTIGDDSLREGLFDQALDGYRSFLDSYPTSTLLPVARRDYITVASDYATHMSGLMTESVGDESKRISQAIDKRLTAVLSDSADAIQDLGDIAERTESQERQYWSMQLDRGRLLLRLGRATPDGAAYLNLAENEMATVASYAPTDSSFELQAYLVLGDVFLAQNRVSDAADCFLYVAEGSIPLDRKKWELLKADLEQAQIQFRWLYIESVTPMLIDTYLRSGRTAAAANTGLHLFNCINGDRLTLSPTGQQAAVAAARCLFEAGGWVGGTAGAANYHWFQTVEDAEASNFTARALRSALEFALTVALDMADNGIGLAKQRAKALISDLIESPGVSFGPEVLFEAARGSFEGGDYAVAASAFRRVVEAVAGNEVEARLWGAKVSWYLGECFRKQDRQLEAAMAYFYGITTWRGDAAYDAKNAQAGYAAIGRAMKVDSEASAYVAIRDQLGAILRSMPDAGKDVAWEFASRKYDVARGESNEDKARGAFVEAVGLFQEVPLDSPNYAKAQGRIGVAHYQAHNVSAATAAFDEFETKRATATDATERARFDAALAEVRYYQGQLAIDARNFQRAFDIYSQYPAQFPEERDKHANALRFAVDAAVALGNIDTALEITRRMVGAYPDANQTLSAAQSVLKPLQIQYLATEEGSPERAAILPTLAEIVVLSNKLTAQPTFGQLRLESRIAIEMRRWNDALAVLERINAAFGGSTDAGMQRNLDLFVKPDLGVVLIELGRLPEAHAILAPLVPDPDVESPKRPSAEVVMGYIKSVAGWPTGDPNKPTVLAGVGGVEELTKAYKWAAKLTTQLGRDHKNDAIWFEARFVDSWALYQWGRVQSDKMDSLRAILANLRSDLGTEFEKLTTIVKADPSLALRFRWLDRLAK